MQNILVTILARGGSKGIPGKNIRPVGGKPLIAYTISAAKKFAARHEADVILSTDSDQIIATAEEWGLPTDYRRPAYLADDHCGKVDAIKDAVEHMERKRGHRYDYIVDLDVSSPMRTQEDIEACLEKIAGDSEALTIFSVSPCRRNPYFNMVERKPDGYFREVCEAKFNSRQQSPEVFDINGSVYVYRREALDTDHPRAVSPRTLVYPMDHLCFDLDEMEDYDRLQYMVETGKITL